MTNSDTYGGIVTYFFFAVVIVVALLTVAAEGILPVATFARGGRRAKRWLVDYRPRYLVVKVGIAAAIAIALFPPWIGIFRGRQIYFGYAFIWSPPNTICTPDISRLIVEWMILGGVFALCALPWASRLASQAASQPPGPYPASPMPAPLSDADKVRAYNEAIYLAALNLRAKRARLRIIRRLEAGEDVPDEQDPSGLRRLSTERRRELEETLARELAEHDALANAERAEDGRSAD